MNESHGHYAYEIHGAAEEHHRHYDTESEIQGLRGDLSRADARIRDLEQEQSATADAVQRLEQTPILAPAPGDPEQWNGLRVLWAPGAAPAARILGLARFAHELHQAVGDLATRVAELEAEDEARGGRGPSASYEAWVAEGRETCEPEPAEYDPGPEVDDEGGMSEYRHAGLGEEPW